MICYWLIHFYSLCAIWFNFLSSALSCPGSARHVRKAFRIIYSRNKMPVIRDEERMPAGCAVCKLYFYVCKVVLAHEAKSHDLCRLGHGSESSLKWVEGNHYAITQNGNEVLGMSFKH